MDLLLIPIFVIVVIFTAVKVNFQGLVPGLGSTLDGTTLYAVISLLPPAEKTFFTVLDSLGDSHRIFTKHA